MPSDRIWPPHLSFCFVASYSTFSPSLLPPNDPNSIVTIYGTGFLTTVNQVSFQVGATCSPTASGLLGSNVATANGATQLIVRVANAGLSTGQYSVCFLLAANATYVSQQVSSSVILVRESFFLFHCRFVLSVSNSFLHSISCGVFVRSSLFLFTYVNCNTHYRRCWFGTFEHCRAPAWSCLFTHWSRRSQCHYRLYLV